MIAGLVGDCVVKWDDRIIDHDPGFQMHDPAVTAALTIRDTYAHRSRLPDHAGDFVEDMGYDRAEILRHLRFIPVKNNFRSHYAYTNFGMTKGAVAGIENQGTKESACTAGGIAGHRVKINEMSCSEARPDGGTRRKQITRPMATRSHARSVAGWRGLSLQVGPARRWSLPQ